MVDPTSGDAFVVGGSSDVTPDEKARALEAVLRSETFARSERLRDLLRFIAEAEMQGRVEALNEYTIGVEALGRPKHFSPTDDSSVRSRAYELRHKLAKYYTTEAPRAPVRIELRKGSYGPRYVRVESNAFALDDALLTVGPEQSPEIAPAPQAPRTSVSGIALGFLGGITVTLLAVSVWMRLTQAQAPPTNYVWTPELEAIWKPFITDADPTIIAFESPLFVQMGPLVVRDSKVSSLAGLSASPSLLSLKQLFGLQQIYEVRNYADAGVVRAMFYLTQLLGTRIPNLAVKSSVHLSAEDYRRSNVILLGRPWMNTRIQRHLAATELIDDNGAVRVVHPRPGEESVYHDESDAVDTNRWGQKYAVISSLPGQPAGKQLLCLLGSGSEHAAALAYYMTNPESAKALYGRMKAEPDGVPRHFQVLVKAVFDGRVPLAVETVAFRVISR